jgi:hypothetical protein
MYASRFAASSRTALFRPLRSGMKRAGLELKLVQERKFSATERKFSAIASHVAAGHSAATAGINSKIRAFSSSSRHQQQAPTHERPPIEERHANVQLEFGLFHQSSNSRERAVLELDIDELSEALQEFLQNRKLAGLPDGEEALHAMSDQLAERASVLYFNELDTTKIQACPQLLAIFKRLEERKVMVLCPPTLEPERRTVGSF